MEVYRKPPFRETGFKRPVVGQFPITRLGPRHAL